MTDRIRIIKHEAVPLCGSFEVRFSDERPSQYFYFDDMPGRRMRSNLVDRATARRAAEFLARAEQDVLDSQTDQSSPKRLAAAPDIPTVSEAGLLGLTVTASLGLLAPSGTPTPIGDGHIARAEARLIVAVASISVSSRVKPRPSTCAVLSEILLVPSRGWMGAV